MPEDKLKLIYDAVSEDYNLKDYETFGTVMRDADKRTLFYNTVSQDYNLGTLEQFDNIIVSSFAPKKEEELPKSVLQLTHKQIDTDKVPESEYNPYNILKDYNLFRQVIKIPEKRRLFFDAVSNDTLYAKNLGTYSEFEKGTAKISLANKYFCDGLKELLKEVDKVKNVFGNYALRKLQSDIEFYSKK